MPASSNPKDFSRAQIVSFRCVLKTQLGQLISSSFNREVLTDVCDVEDKQFPALASGLKNLRQGEKRRICVPAAEAYGLYDKELVVEISRKKIAPVSGLSIGQEIVVENQDGSQKPFRVIGLTGTRVTLDGNHPLAGQDLVFDIEATEVREATAEEMKRDKIREITKTRFGYLH